MKKIFIFLALALCCFGCRDLPTAVKPYHQLFTQMPQHGSDAFKQGWKDGCNSGLAAMTNSMYRSFYRYTQDRKMISNPEYYKAWKDTYHFCRHSAYGIIRQSDLRMRLPNDPRNWFDTPSFHNVFEKGMLNLWGPGTWGIYLENWGETKGTGFFEPAGVLDFSGDMLWTGEQRGVMDFTPKHSIVPY